MGFAVLLIKLPAEGEDAAFPFKKVENLLQAYTPEAERHHYKNGFDFFRNQPWFEDIDIAWSDGSAKLMEALIISKPDSIQPQLKDILFSLLSLENTALVDESFSFIHSRYDLTKNIPSEIKKMFEAENQTVPFQQITSVDEVWPSEW